ncbi:uncharacterized protein LOC135394595 [Ornithodoros turicata]|uniref:uncharacterized protein LOC135394595 n=1 Tax=Ornithodoros turicata TaxID=34597 RepID=UPI003139CA0A
MSEEESDSGTETSSNGEDAESDKEQKEGKKGGGESSAENDSNEGKKNKDEKEKKATDKGDTADAHNKEENGGRGGEAGKGDDKKKSTKDDKEAQGKGKDGDKDSKDKEPEPAVGSTVALQEGSGYCSNFVSRILSKLGVFVLPWLYCLIMYVISRYMSREDELCLNNSCKTASSYVRASINTSLNPCDNFYDYVCQGWMKNFQNDIDSATSMLTFPLYFNSSDNASGNVAKALRTLKHCQDAFGAVDDSSADDLLQFLHNNLNLLWPQRTEGGPQAVIDLVVYLQMTYDISPFFDMLFSSGMAQLTIDVNRRYRPWYTHYSRTRGKEFRKALITKVVASMSTTPYPNLVANIIAVEDSISSIDSNVDDTFQTLKVRVLAHSEFNHTWPLVSAIWRLCKSRQRRILLKRTRALLIATEKLESLLTLLQDASMTEAILDFIGWITVEILGRRLSPTVRRAIQQTCTEFKVDPVTKHVIREDSCYREVYRLFALVLDRNTYHTSNHTALARFESIFHNLQSRIALLLDDTGWVDTITKGGMVRALNNFGTQVGMLKKYRFKGVETRYSKLKPVDESNSFLKNFLLIARSLSSYLLSVSFQDTYPRDYWTVIAKVRYLETVNTIFVPLSTVKSKLHGDDPVPLSLLYGSTVLQMAVATFNEGYLGYTGIMETAWSSVTQHRFDVFMSCFRNNFDSRGPIPDNPTAYYIRLLALRTVFHMYRLAVQRQKGDTVLLTSNDPLKRLSAHQLFFVTTCLNLCTRDEENMDQFSRLCNLPMRRIKSFSTSFFCDSIDMLAIAPFNCTPLRLAQDYYRTNKTIF